MVVRKSCSLSHICCSNDRIQHLMARLWGGCVSLMTESFKYSKMKNIAFAKPLTIDNFRTKSTHKSFICCHKLSFKAFHDSQRPLKVKKRHMILQKQVVCSSLVIHLNEFASENVKINCRCHSTKTLHIEAQKCFLSFDWSVGHK